MLKNSKWLCHDTAAGFIRSRSFPLALKVIQYTTNQRRQKERVFHQVISSILSLLLITNLCCGNSAATGSTRGEAALNHNGILFIRPRHSVAASATSIEAGLKHKWLFVPPHRTASSRATSGYISLNHDQFPAGTPGDPAASHMNASSREGWVGYNQFPLVPHGHPTATRAPSGELSQRQRAFLCFSCDLIFRPPFCVVCNGNEGTIAGMCCRQGVIDVWWD